MNLPDPLLRSTATSHGEHEPRPYSMRWYQQQCQQLGESACRQLGWFSVPEDFRLSIVVPIFNEAATLSTLVERIAAAPFATQIILVDDGSTDATPQIIQQLLQQYSNHADLELVSICLDRNRGKGAALKRGFAKVTGEIVVIQDADLEYDPVDYPRLLRPIVQDQADVVFGSRFVGDQPRRVLYHWHYVSNRFLTMLSNLATGLNLTDMETGYKAFRKSVLDDIGPQLRENRFGFEPEFTARVARRGLRVFETAISYCGRTYREGKKVGIRDGFKAIWCILRYCCFR